MVVVLGLATMVVVMWEKFNRPEHRTTRALVFIALVSEGLVFFDLSLSADK